MSTDPLHDRRLLDLAARLAMRAAGDVEPNPLVGAVLVRDGRIIGVGHHRRFGGPHAEREAFNDAARRNESTRDATLYVTLEPCRTTGKQPPCTRAILDAGIARVVFAADDPHPEKGDGASDLRAAGVECERCDESPFATGLSAPFRKRVTTGWPWVVAKWAQTIDGRVATRTGESKWISGERARARVHRLRARVDAILTGIGTILADDPMLTARGVRRVRRLATRVIADTELDVPIDAKVVQSARDVPTIVACDEVLLNAPIVAEKVAALRAAGVQLLGVPIGAGGLDLRELLRRLAERHAIASLLVEAGPGLVGSMLEHDLIDEAVVYIAPMMLGDEFARAVAVGRVAESLTAARRFELRRVKALEGDVELTYRGRG